MVRLQSFRSVYGLVSSYIQDDRLRQVMSFHPLLVGGNPFTTTSIYTLIAFLERTGGAHFPIGGTGGRGGRIGRARGATRGSRCPRPRGPSAPRPAVPARWWKGSSGSSRGRGASCAARRRSR